MGVPGLIVTLDQTFPAFTDHGTDPVEIPIKNVDAGASNREPAASIDPWTPAADRGHAGGGACII
jgi:hypothetical protein